MHSSGCVRSSRANRTSITPTCRGSGSSSRSSVPWCRAKASDWPLPLRLQELLERRIPAQWFQVSEPVQPPSGVEAAALRERFLQQGHGAVLLAEHRGDERALERVRATVTVALRRELRVHAARFGGV